MGLDWKAIVRGIAPTIGTVISGGNPLAGGAMKMLAETLLGKPDATEEDIASFVKNARPEDLVPLKKIEADYNAKMAELGLRPLELEMQDRASARGLFQIDSGPQKLITYLFLGGYFAVLVAFVISMLSGGKLSDVPPVFALIFGVVTGAVPQIMSFWFGSSKSSQDKSEALARSKPADTL